jgi:hypothetical protein
LVVNGFDDLALCAAESANHGTTASAKLDPSARKNLLLDKTAVDLRPVMAMSHPSSAR